MPGNYNIKSLISTVVNNVKQLRYSLISDKESVYKLLLKIRDMEIENIKFQKHQYEQFDIYEKIDFNELERFKESYEYFMEQYFIVDDCVNSIMQQESSFSDILIRNIFSIYRDTSSVSNSNERLDKVVETIKNNLGYRLDNDSLSYVDSIVFYVFAKCKIFKKLTHEKG